VRKDSEAVNLLKNPDFFACKPLKTRERKNQNSINSQLLWLFGPSYPLFVIRGGDEAPGRYRMTESRLGQAWPLAAVL
jgi:hypothetical protein